MIALPLLLSADVLTGQEVTIFYKWRLSQQRGVTFLGGGVTAFTGREVYVLGGVLTVLTGRELTVLGEVVTVVTDREVAVLGGVVFDRDGSHCRRTVTRFPGRAMTVLGGRELTKCPLAQDFLLINLKSLLAASPDFRERERQSEKARDRERVCGGVSVWVCECVLDCVSV